MSATAYPLSWPAGWPRQSGSRIRPTGSAKCGFVYARDKIAEEVRRMKADDAILSTNCQLLLNGQPRGDQSPADPGVAIYFTMRGKSMVMATDYFSEVGSNIWRLAMSMAYLRGLERHGGGTMLERAFAGFAALPEPGRVAPWREVFGVAPGGSISPLELEDLYRRLAKQRHPDLQGGSEALMVELNRAVEDARREMGIA